MVSKSENRDREVKTHFMQVISGNPKTRILKKEPHCCIFWSLGLWHSDSWKKYKVVKKKMCASWKWFPKVKTVTMRYKPTLCN